MTVMTENFFLVFQQFGKFLRTKGPQDGLDFVYSYVCNRNASDHEF